MRAIITFAIVFFCNDTIAAPVTMTPYLHPQRPIAVQGTRHLNLYCVGKGRPTVLFDSGLSDSTAVWRLVQPSVAKATRACAYDRAGYGFSDPPVGISDAKAAVADIHRLILAAPITGPIVYVGHSIAGLYGVLLSATHPGDIAAEVLVDPSFANQAFTATASFSPKERAHWFEQNEIAVAQMKKCATMPPPLPKDCLGGDSETRPGDTELAALERQRVSRRSYILANASELENFTVMHGRKSVDQRELEVMPPGFGDKPLVILTHGKSGRFPDLTRQQNAIVEEAWNEGHNQLAALSSRGSNTVVPGSTHSIQIDHPQAVIDAVLKAVSQVRQSHVP